MVEVKYDESLKELGPESLANSVLKYCIHFSTHERFPQTGWLLDNVREMAIDIQHARASVKNEELEANFNDAISAVAGLVGQRPKATLQKISDFLHQPESKQTWGMAALTLSGAIAFHDEVAEHNGIQTIGELTVLGNTG